MDRSFPHRPLPRHPHRFLCLRNASYMDSGAPTLTLESLILTVNASGWTVSLYQRPDHWCANLHSDAEGFTQCGLGASPIEAIEHSLVRPERTYFEMTPLKAEERIDLAALGLVKQREPLNRRF